MNQSPPDIHSSSDDYISRFLNAGGKFLLNKQSQIISTIITAYRLSLATALDVGGGHFQSAPILAQAGIKVTITGSDYSCQQQMLKTSPNANIEFKVSSLCPLPFPEHSYDLVSTFRVLSHLDNFEDFIGECCRVAKVAVIFDYPTTKSLNYLSRYFFKTKLAVEKNTRTFNSFSDNQIKELLAKNGFQIKQIERELFWPHFLHRAVNNKLLSNIIEKPAEIFGITQRFGSPVIVFATRV
ncbi:MAG TPA: class I SAM-dependent methyltransferase [Oligoflexia bacterium]|nr:class I SAM-dependent methyltransferase [Oligoflexia bacterium]HMP27713.1 class I SAM-dependent methyltransferase [Oligoflexia bacterium]